MEARQISEADIPKNQEWKAAGRGNKDIKKILKELRARYAPSKSEGKLFWKISRIDTFLMCVELDESISRAELLKECRSLRLVGLRAAIEKLYNIQIEEDVLEEVGFYSDSK